MEIRNALETAYNAVIDKKGEDVTALDVSGITPEFDCFLIATGRNANHCQTLADAAEEKLAEKGMLLRHREGYNGATWILLDFGSIIVHIFDREQREFYNLEHIWGDAEVVAL